VQKAIDLYLIDVLSQLGPEALLDAVGLRPSLQTPSTVNVQALSKPGIHPVGIVHITDGVEKRSLFAKIRKADYRGAQDVEREFRFLSEVAPLITAENPALRSPRPVAYYPEQHLLLMEFVPGDPLNHLLFDIKFSTSRAGRPDLAELLQCAGRWLGSLHRLTLQNVYDNPLEWVLREFDSERTKEAFLLYSLKDSYAALLSLLRRRLDQNPGFRRRQCTVHGEFTPIHIMVTGKEIYVIDFGNTRPGYAYEDIGLFTTFFDSLLPWRAVAGSFRIRLEMQKELFLRGYFEQAHADFTAADEAIMRWVRLISFARLLNGRLRSYRGWKRMIHSRIVLGRLHNRFITLCASELAALKGMPPDIFHEDPRRRETGQPAPF
jgi:tRNA A-37 threonylcarbamoyl transferase component Bud32